MRFAACALVVLVACAPASIVTPSPSTSSSGTATPAATPTSFAMVEGHYNVRFGAIALALAAQSRIDLIGATEGALRRVEAILPGPTPDILIDVDPALIIPEVGIGGFTDPRTGAVRIALDSRPANLLAIVRDWLPGSLAHELHHSRRVLAGPGYGTTVREAIVSEGLAAAFEREAFPTAPIAPWVTALDAQAQHRVWQSALASLELPDTAAEHQRWFFGSTIDVPRWSGYTIGAEIVNAYVRSHPGSAPSRLVKTSAAEIVVGSGYSP